MSVRATFQWPAPVPMTAHVAKMQPAPPLVPKKEEESNAKDQ